MHRPEQFKGKNLELMEQCATLEGYAILVDKIRENMDAEMELSEAVDKAIVYCINQNILRDFLSKHRAEVTRVLLTEYDAKKQRQLDKRDWIEEGERIGEARGREIGLAHGEDRYARLSNKLLSDKRYNDLERAGSDPEYRKKLFREFDL